MTSDGLIGGTKLPEHLIILGGGYISLEFASFYTSFGSRVTLLQQDDKFIPREDSEIAGEILKALEAKGMTLIRNVATERVDDKGEKVVVKYKVGDESKEIEGDILLVATGRRPNLEGLNPENAGIELTDRGAIKVNSHMQTNKAHIYAMGDIVGAAQFTYKSLDDYRIVKAALEGGTYEDVNRSLPYSVFIDPTFSRVGMTADEAVAAGYKIKEGKLPAAAIPKAHVLQCPVGLLKAVVDADTDKILGASIFCKDSHEMINLIKMAIDAGLPYTAIRDQIFTHPTMIEALNDLFSI